MKVIHLISGGDTGGAKTHIHYLLSGISKKTDTTLVCFMKGEFSDEAKALGIPTVVIEGGMLRALRALRRMIASGEYELIHSHGARGNFLAAILKIQTRTPMVSTVHSDPKLDYMGRPLARLTYGTLNSLALRCADYLVGVSDSMRDLLIRRRFPANRIFSIYNGVDFSLAPQTENRLDYLQSLGLDADENSVVAGIAARLDPVKDVATLILGFHLAQKQNPNLRLVIAGSGGEEAALKTLAKDLGLGKSICFAGWLSDIGRFYSAIDINVLCSLSETFPYAITEGARARLATISTPVGGVPKLVKPGKTGYLFPVGNAGALAEKLVLLASDHELRRTLGESIYDCAKGEFSVEATTDRQLAIYTEILHRRSKKAAKERYGIIICGAYGMGNSGDDAILEAIVGAMRRLNEFLPITALSRNPVETRNRFGIESVHTLNIFGFRRVMRRTKLYISGGGSLMQNVTSRRSLWYYLYSISTAKKLGNRVMMYGCGIGPIVDDRDEARLQKTLNRCVDVITLRESFSLSELKRFGVSDPQMLVSSDPAITLPPASEDKVEEYLRSFGLTPEGTYVCFSVRSWAGFDEKAPIFALAADYAAEKLGVTPVFMLINRKEDDRATELVRSAMVHDSIVIDAPLDSNLTVGVLSHMSAMVSMRLHGLIFAASTGVPLVGVSYDPKVTAFLDSVGEELCIPLENVERMVLCSMLQKAFEGASNSGQRAKTVNHLVSMEKQNSDWAQKLLQ